MIDDFRWAQNFFFAQSIKAKLLYFLLSVASDTRERIELWIKQNSLVTVRNAEKRFMTETRNETIVRRCSFTHESDFVAFSRAFRWDLRFCVIAFSELLYKFTRRSVLTWKVAIKTTITSAFGRMFDNSNWYRWQHALSPLHDCFILLSLTAAQVRPITLFCVIPRMPNFTVFLVLFRGDTQ